MVFPSLIFNVEKYLKPLSVQQIVVNVNFFTILC